jgi:hypothetical protein
MIVDDDIGVAHIFAVVKQLGIIGEGDENVGLLLMLLVELLRLLVVFEGRRRCLEDRIAQLRQSAFVGTRIDESVVPIVAVLGTRGFVGRRDVDDTVRSDRTLRQ